MLEQPPKSYIFKNETCESILATYLHINFGDVCKVELQLQLMIETPDGLSRDRHSRFLAHEAPAGFAS